ncbi:adenosine receptor A3-like [Porites lutea]|uniref:adenosine receptor A3-like n=1 Tax=Porites lutea TaxID=51062 RepID=UPI003CC69BDA
MSVSDLGVGLVAQPLQIYLLVSIINILSPPHIWPDHYEAVLKAYRVVANVLTYASFFSIVALSADRFLVIRLQLRYQDAVTHKRAIAGVISFWLLSAFLPLLRFLEWLPENKSFILFVTIQFICLIISGLFYFMIFLALRQHAAQVQNVPVECGERNEAVNAARERKAAFGVFYVYLTFVACYLPQICFNIAGKIIDIERRPFLVYKGNLHATNLLVLNSSLSPLIYCWKMRRIRQAMIDVLRKPFQN